MKSLDVQLTDEEWGILLYALEFLHNNKIAKNLVLKLQDEVIDVGEAE